MNKYLIIAQFTGEMPTMPQDSSDLIQPTFWVDISNPDRKLIVAQFADRVTAEEKEKALFESVPPLPNWPTPDIRGVSVKESKGQSLDEAGESSHLSVVSHLTAIGKGVDVSDRISETLVALASMPGYLGHVLGSNVSLDEELWALVLWDGEPSPPPNTNDISYSCFSLSI